MFKLPSFSDPFFLICQTLISDSPPHTPNNLPLIVAILIIIVNVGETGFGHVTLRGVCVFLWCEPVCVVAHRPPWRDSAPSDLSDCLITSRELLNYSLQ